MEKNEEYIPKTSPLDREMHRDIYNDILKGTDPYFTEEKVTQIMRDDMPLEVVLKGTQGCDAVNNADVTMAPKTHHYSSTCSLG